MRPRLILSALLLAALAVLARMDLDRPAFAKASKRPARSAAAR